MGTSTYTQPTWHSTADEQGRREHWRLQGRLCLLLHQCPSTSSSSPPWHNPARLKCSHPTREAIKLVLYFDFSETSHVLTSVLDLARTLETLQDQTLCSLAEATSIATTTLLADQPANLECQLKGFISSALWALHLYSTFKPNLH